MDKRTAVLAELAKATVWESSSWLPATVKTIEYVDGEGAACQMKYFDLKTPNEYGLTLLTQTQYKQALIQINKTR